MLKYYAFLLLFLFSQTAHSQFISNLDELSFHSDFEKKCFNEIESSKINRTLKLLVASSADNDEATYNHIHGVIDAFLKKLDSKDIRKKSYKKSSKLIYEAVHETFLKKYQEYASIEEIFRSGTFNCVTATALYTIIFEYFDIPYSIQLEPYHVFAIVDPLGDNIIIESTDPENGVYQVTDKVKKEYIQQLVDSKLINESDVNKKNINELFESYYLSQNESIKLEDLAGIQYYNNSLYASGQANDKLALELVEKSDFLYHAPRNEYVIYLSILNLLLDVDYYDEKSLENIIKFSRLKPGKESKAEIKNQFVNISELFLIEESDPERMEDIYQQFMANIKDEETKTELKLIYYVQNSRAAIMRFHNQSAITYVDSAYQLKPKNLKIRGLLSEIVLESLRKTKDYHSSYEDFRFYQTKYPFLKDNPYFDEYELYCLASFTEENFRNNNEKEGFIFKDQFDSALENLNDKNHVSNLIGAVYASTSNYFARKADFNNAKIYLEKGLVLAPAQSHLVSTLKLLNE